MRSLLDETHKMEREDEPREDAKASESKPKRNERGELVALSIDSLLLPSLPDRNGHPPESLISRIRLDDGEGDSELGRDSSGRVEGRSRDDEDSVTHCPFESEVTSILQGGDVDEEEHSGGGGYCESSSMREGRSQFRKEEREARRRRGRGLTPRGDSVEVLVSESLEPDSSVLVDHGDLLGVLEETGDTPLRKEGKQSE